MHNVAPGRQQVVKERALSSMVDKADGQARPKTGKLARTQFKKAITSPIISTGRLARAPITQNEVKFYYATEHLCS
jgi:hypothetical protein